MCSVHAVRYYVTFEAGTDASPAVVDLVEHPDGKLDATIDGRAVSIDVVAVGAQQSLRIDGRVFDVTAHGKLPNLGIVASGVRAAVRVESERSRSSERAEAPARGGDRTVVKSPMPGRVVRVLVGPGDRVKPGQGLVVLEAMKMENEVRSTVEATVSEVLVATGATVEASARLIVLSLIGPRVGP